jgi:lipid-binding SYLF domain-containing protein
MGHFARVLALTLLVAWAGAANARSKADLDAGVQATLGQFYALDPGNRELVQRAAGALVMPDLTKAGVGIGAEFGEAALLVDGSVREYYTVTGAALGALLGVGQRAEVILFMTSAARDAFMRGQRWTLDADAGATFAARGFGAHFAGLAAQRPVLAYVVGERGLIGDLSIAGLRITPASE